MKEEENTKIGTKISQEELSNISGEFFRKGGRGVIAKSFHQNHFLESGGEAPPIPSQNGIFG